jgi:hypothetical protein
MSKADEIRAYSKRWEKVAEVERAELERMSPAQKLADLSLLMEFARKLGGEDEVDKDVEQVRRRWNLLAERMGV